MVQIGTDISHAENLLRRGELVAIPTETVYGLAANGLNSEAAVKIFEVKNRPAFDPLILHTNSLEKAKEFVESVPEAAEKLAKAFWPGPLTLLLPKKSAVPEVVTSGLANVAVRVPNHPLTLKLLEKLDFPLAAPSANPFGYISPTTAEHVADQLGDKIPYILDGGPAHIGVESTIVGFEGDTAIIYRLGGMEVEQIEQYCSKVKLMPHSSSNPQAPGMLKSHYAPRVPIIVGDVADLLMESDKEDIAILSFKDSYPEVKNIVLSPSGDLRQAAQNLFKALRELDKLPIKKIFAELVPNYGIGRAINDRLTRAAAEKEK